MKRGKKRPWRRFLLLLLLLALAALAWFGQALYRKVFSPYQGYEKQAVVQIDSGMSVAAIGRRLQSRGVIASADYFTRYYRLFFAGKKLKAGEYLFDAPLSMRQVIEKLEEGKAILYKVTVKEGLWIGETAQVFEAAGLFPAAEFVRAASPSRPGARHRPGGGRPGGLPFPRHLPGAQGHHGRARWPP